MPSLRNGRRRAVLAAASVAAAVSVLAAPGAAAEPAAPAAPAHHVGGELPALDYDAVEERMAEATDMLADEGVQLGMALYDRATGRMVANPNGAKPFPLASVVKVFVAEVVAYANYERPDGGTIEAGRGDMAPAGNQDAMLRDDALRYSDNEATATLWRAYGQGRIMDSVRERYNLSDATQPRANWAASTSSPEDMATLLAGILDGAGGLPEEESDYLVRLMYSLPKYSYGNADQDFGLREALDGERVGQKGGWSDPHIRASVGFLGEDQRFTMAVLTTGDGTTTAATRAVEHVFPDGVVVPHLHDGNPGAPVAAPAAAGAAPVRAVAALAALAVAVAGFVLGWAVRGSRIA